MLAATDVAVLLFALTNALRILASLPQIASLVLCRGRLVQHAAAIPALQHVDGDLFGNYPR